MRSLINKFFGYTDRTYEQQMANILQKANTPDGVPEMTDHTDSNLWIKTIRIWLGISELFHAYIDNMAQERFPTTAEEFASLYHYAESVDYRIKGRISAKTDQTFFITAAIGQNITIPAGTRVKSVNGLFFVTLESAVIPAGQTEVTVSVANETTVSNQVIGTGNGLPWQKYTIANNVVDNSITFDTGVLHWIPVETLAYSQSNEFNFVAGLNKDRVMTVTTGDGINGSMPGAGIDLIATYKITDGALGNLPALTINEVDSNVSVPSGVVLQTINRQPSVGGADEEDVNQVRTNAIASQRTLDKAVTLRDYELLAMKASGVGKARAKYSERRAIELYIAPVGTSNGIAPTALLNSTHQYLADKRLVGKPLNVISAGIVKLRLKIKISLLPGFSKAAKAAETKSVVSQLFNIQNQEIYGSMEVGDIYEKVEGIRGIKVSEVLEIIPVPYARPLNHTTQLNWVRQLLEGSTSTIKWKVVKNDESTYKLLKNGAYVGTYGFGNDVTLNEIEMTIDYAGYADNSSWEFVTYAYNQTGPLDEPSIPVIDEDDIEVIVEGGI